MSSSLPRITARVDIETLALLSQAAAIAGVSSINQFVLSASVEKAKQIMEREHVLKLTQVDAKLLADALDAPVKANTRLQQAANRYEDKTQS